MRLAALPLSLAAVLVAAVAACGGSENTYRVPTDTPLRPYAAPEAEDLIEDDAEPVEETAPPAAEAAAPEATAPAPAPATPEKPAPRK